MINPRGIEQKSFSQSFDSFHIKSGLLFRKCHISSFWRTIMIYNLWFETSFLSKKKKKRLFSSATTMIPEIKNHVSFRPALFSPANHSELKCQEWNFSNPVIMKIMWVGFCNKIRLCNPLMCIQMRYMWGGSNKSAVGWEISIWNVSVKSSLRVAWGKNIHCPTGFYSNIIVTSITFNEWTKSGI